MRVVIALLALSTAFVASAAIAADAKELHRDNLTFCSQFVIHDPDPRIVLDYMQVIVHVFHREKREFYSLEDLWGDAPRLEWEPAEERR